MAHMVDLENYCGVELILPDGSTLESKGLAEMSSKMKVEGVVNKKFPTHILEYSCTGLPNPESNTMLLVPADVAKYLQVSGHRVDVLGVEFKKARKDKMGGREVESIFGPVQLRKKPYFYGEGVK